MADLNPKMRAAAVTLVMPFLGTLAHAQGTTSLNTFGMPGLIDIPTAQSLEDADLATSLAISEGQSRSTLTFQITPRLTGSFRYSRIDGFRGTDLDLYDRSFDLHYRLIDEGAFRPALAIGLRDLVGTGVYSSEYLVASKNLPQGVLVTAGIGWGAMGSYNGFDNPLAFLGERFESRSTFEGEGGEPNIDNWFHGPAALFAGVRWQASDRLTFSAEYSSDDQSRQQGGGDAGLASPFNFGVQYRMGEGTMLGAQVLQGESVGVSAHFVINPRKPNYGGDVSAAAMPVLVRGDTAATWAGAINQDTLPDHARTDALRRLLENEGITLNAIALRETSVRVNIHNTRYDAPAQAIGRTARALAFTMPAQVETFEIVLVEKGVPLSQVTLSRSALERLDYAPDAVEQGLAVTRFDAASRDGDMTQLPFERFSWSVGPYIGFSFFDPDNPLRADLSRTF